jgi:hypothetical protein
MPVRPACSNPRIEEVFIILPIPRFFIILAISICTGSYQMQQISKLDSAVTKRVGFLSSPAASMMANAPCTTVAVVL